MNKIDLNDITNTLEVHNQMAEDNPVILTTSSLRRKIDKQKKQFYDIINK